MSDTFYLTKKDVAARLQINERTVDRWCDQGKLPFIKVGQGHRAPVRFMWADIVARLNQKFGYNLN